MATVEKRELTDEERQEATRLMAAWKAFKDANPGATQAWLGAATDLGSQGLMGQYLRGIIPLNLRALVSICAQIGADANQISPRIMKPVHDFNATIPRSAEAKAASDALTTAVKNSLDEKNPSGDRRTKVLNTSFSQKLAALKDELARAEREGQLSEEKIELLLGVLRLDAPSASKRHTTRRILTERKPRQSDERTERKKAG